MKVLYLAALLCFSYTASHFTHSDVKGKYTLLEGPLILRLCARNYFFWRCHNSWRLPHRWKCVLHWCLSDGNKASRRVWWITSIWQICLLLQLLGRWFSIWEGNINQISAFPNHCGISCRQGFQYEKGNVYLTINWHVSTRYCVYIQNDGSSVKVSPSPSSQAALPPSTDSAPTPAETTDPDTTPTQPRSIWIWLGPVLGFIAFILPFLIRVFFARSSS